MIGGVHGETDLSRSCRRRVAHHYELDSGDLGFEEPCYWRDRLRNRSQRSLHGEGTSTAARGATQPRRAHQL